VDKGPRNWAFRQGPVYADLKAGTYLTLEDGRIIVGDTLTGPGSPWLQRRLLHRTRVL